MAAVTATNSSASAPFEDTSATAKKKKARAVRFASGDITQIITGKTHKKARIIIEESIENEKIFKSNYGTATRFTYKETQEKIVQRVLERSVTDLEKARSAALTLAREVAGEEQTDTAVTSSSSSSSHKRKVLPASSSSELSTVPVPKNRRITRSATLKSKKNSPS